jgi:hypothetical protein
LDAVREAIANFQANPPEIAEVEPMAASAFKRSYHGI